MQKIVYTVEDVAAGEESAEDLGVVRVQPVAAKLEIMFSVNNGEIVAELRAPNRFVNVWIEEERIAESEGGPESHSCVRWNLG